MKFWKRKKTPAAPAPKATGPKVTVSQLAQMADCSRSGYYLWVAQAQARARNGKGDVQPGPSRKEE